MQLISKYLIYYFDKWFLRKIDFYAQLQKNHYQADAKNSDIL